MWKVYGSNSRCCCPERFSRVVLSLSTQTLVLTPPQKITHANCEVLYFGLFREANKIIILTEGCGIKSTNKWQLKFHIWIMEHIVTNTSGAGCLVVAVYWKHTEASQRSSTSTVWTLLTDQLWSQLLKMRT